MNNFIIHFLNMPGRSGSAVDVGGRTARGRFAPSAEGKKNGITLLVPTPVVEQEQKELMSCLTAAKVQNLMIFLKRGGIKHMDIDAVLKKGEYKGYCPLHVAVLCGTSTSVSAILELTTAATEVSTVKPAEYVGEKPLHAAARRGDVGMVRTLLQHGADANAFDQRMITPLMGAAAAATRGSFHATCAAELIHHGAQVTRRDHNGDTALHLACDTPLALELVQNICKAAKEKDTSGLAEAIEAINLAGEGVLHRAISRRHADVAKHLLGAGARSDARSAAGDTAMHCAAREGVFSIVELLLASGTAKTEALNAANLEGETPLHLAMAASSASHAAIARLLLGNGAYAFGRTRSGETVLHACAREGNHELASQILKRQTAETADCLNTRSLHGGTPLHVAVKANQRQMVTLLLKQPGVDRGLVDAEGNTVVQLACVRGDLLLLQLLLRNGAAPIAVDALTVKNLLGWGALHTAAFSGTLSAVQMLVEHRAPVDSLTVDGWTPLMLASSQGHTSVVRHLIGAGAELDARHPSGESALGVAAARGHHAVIRELLQLGASPGAASDEYGWTPMHAAVSRGEETVALSLLNKGGRLRAKVEQGSEPPRVGDPIDLAHPSLRGVLFEADERRRRENRLAGRDSDDGGEFEVAPPAAEPPGGAWPVPLRDRPQILLPDATAGKTYRPPLRPDRSGLFGYYGDIRDVKAATTQGHGGVEARAAWQAQKQGADLDLDPRRRGPFGY